MAGNKHKTEWDLYRLGRFGRAALALNSTYAHLILVVGSQGQYMQMTIKAVCGAVVVPVLVKFVVLEVGGRRTHDFKGRLY